MAKKKKTPMMEQYQKVKDRYPDCFVFFRLGDFYEMFNEDAIQASKILEITLTSRNKNMDQPIPMCGVPYHSSQDYIKRLIDAGYKVAICEQMEDPKLTKGMVKRDVVQVVTPGTILQDKALAQKENNYLAYLTEESGYFVLSYADLSTGELYLTESRDFSRLLSELQTVEPSELVHLSNLREDRLTLLNDSTNIYLTTYSAAENLTYDIEDILGDLSAEHRQKENLVGLMSYIESVQMRAVTHMQTVVFYELIDYLQMTHYTKSQLELTKSLRTQRKEGSLLWYLDRSKTAMGGRQLRQWLDKPLLGHDALLERHNKVDQLLNHYFERLDIEEALSRVYDLERLVTKISLSKANARDLNQLKQSLAQIPYLNQVLKALNQNYDGDQDYAFNLLEDFSDLVENIDACLKEDPPISIKEGGVIADGYHPQLDKYRQALNHGQEWLIELQQRERERTGLKTLKVGFNKVFGYYIEISRLQAAEFDDPRYHRKQTLAKAERFITDELKEIEETILEAEEKAKDLEYDLFVELRDNLSHSIPDLQYLAKQVASLDVLCSFASIAESENLVRPVIADQAKQVILKGSRHPVVESMIGKDRFVVNDLTVTPDQSMLLLTGPNMSGKSTFMRQLAYALIMNQIGCFVAADYAKLPIVDQIFTRIGSADDIAKGQSTFMVEMMETREALLTASSQSLLLFDEIGRGTATYDGMALAQGIIDYIVNHVQALTLFSTHYHELTDLEKTLASLRNIHVGASEEKGRLLFHHQILEGPADKSYGIHVAKLAGLPEELIQNSQKILEGLESKATHKSGQVAPSQGQAKLEKSSEDSMKSYASLIDRIKNFDPNQSSPIDALVFLAEIKEDLDM